MEQDEEEVPSLSDLSQLFASVSLNEFVLILVREDASTAGDVPLGNADHSEDHYWDLNGLLITITRHNKIMQIFTTQTSK